MGDVGNNVLPFSSDSAFNELSDKDKTVELSWYVCSVQAAQDVGKIQRYRLLKFGLSNGATKKVQCLIWGQPLIDTYQENIVINKRIHIDGAHCKVCRLSYAMENEGYCPFEIIIQASTVITFFGMFEPEVPLQVDEVLQEVTFETINQVQGKISINGFLKTKFTSIPSRFENASYGSGSITDGTWKIGVSIANYVPMPFEKGDAIQIVGFIDNNSSLPLNISCPNKSGVRRRDNVERMSDSQLLEGSRPVKRRQPPV